MTDNAGFEKVTQSDKPLYGPRKLLLCGFGAGLQPKFEAVLEMAGLTGIARVWVTGDQGEVPISQLLELADGSGKGVSSDLPRTIVAAGIQEKQLIGLMQVCKKTGMKNALWAALTPTSENWTIRRLLAELSAEREAMEKK